jgi:hypothetical protein
MRSRLAAIGANDRAASVLEFALAVPILVAMLVGIAELGIVLFANAGLETAVAEGARMASLNPRPDDDVILAKMAPDRFALDPENISGPTLTVGETAAGHDYVDVAMGYSTRLHFLFIETPPIAWRKTRRVYVTS